MDPALQKFLNTPITWNRFVERSSRGDASYGPDTELKSMVDGSTTKVINSRGEEVISKWTLLICDPAFADATTDDLITLPFTTTLPVLSIAPVIDENGNLDYYVVNL